MKPKLIILQTVLPDYRRNFFAMLQAKLHDEVSVYGGEAYFDASITTDQSIVHHKVKNQFFLGRKFLWQKGVRKLAKHPATLVMELNPWVISNWFLLLSRKRTQYKTILWGHAWSRSGKSSKTEFIRHKMRSLAMGIITYTEAQKEALQEKMPDMPIVAASNAMWHAADMVAVTDEPKHLLYVGRITASKKIDTLVLLFEKSLDIIPLETELRLVGDGPELETIRQYVTDQSLQDRVKLYGRITDKQKLRDLYATTICTVCAGEVGLFMTQSFGFGVPMLVASDEKHGPEIAAAIADENMLYFDNTDVKNFRSQLSRFFKNQKQWIDRRPEIARHCASQYSVEAMAQTFINLVRSHEA